MGLFFCHCCLEGQRKLRVIIQGEDRFTFKKDADRRIAFGKVSHDSDEVHHITGKARHTLGDNHIDVILSHTCPFKYEPVEVFLPGIDQSTVDTSTEKWLDAIEDTTDYIAWFCGHWHINKRIDDMHFLFHQFESSEAIQKIAMARRFSN